ncbi:MAG: hypothetical protein [Microvirus sp.]|nr:MAG: hypothetical protein [Microvirus sp.]
MRRRSVRSRSRVRRGRRSNRRSSSRLRPGKVGFRL